MLDLTQDERRVAGELALTHTMSALKQHTLVYDVLQKMGFDGVPTLTADQRVAWAVLQLALVADELSIGDEANTVYRTLAAHSADWPSGASNRGCSMKCDG